MFALLARGPRCERVLGDGVCGPLADAFVCVTGFLAAPARRDDDTAFAWLPAEVFERIVVMLDAATLLALRGACVSLRTRVVAAVRSLHDHDARAGAVFLHCTEVTTSWRGLRDLHIACLTRLTRLELHDCPAITDDALARMHALQSLSLVGPSHVSGSCFAALGATLHTLSLFRNFAVDGAQLRHLTRLATLNLHLTKSYVTGPHLLPLAESLTALDLSENRFVDGESLSALVHLRSLLLWSNDEIRDEHLVQLTQLQHLNLRSNALITGETLSHTPLLSLNLRNNSTFTNRSLERITTLRELDITLNVRIDYDWFSEHRPQLRFVR